MTEEDLPFDYREIPQVQKKSNRKYWQNQNAKRGQIFVLKQLIKRFRDIRTLKGFRNDSTMLGYLLDIEKSARDKDDIVERKVCSSCDTLINIHMDDYTGINHQKIDKNSNCFGSIVTKYGLKDTKDKQQKAQQESEDKSIIDPMTF